MKKFLAVVAIANRVTVNSGLKKIKPKLTTSTLSGLVKKPPLEL